MNDLLFIISVKHARSKLPVHNREFLTNYGV